MIKPMPNSKYLLKKIDEEYNLNIEKKAWEQTQRDGKVILKKLKEKLWVNYRKLRKKAKEQ